MLDREGRVHTSFDIIEIIKRSWIYGKHFGKFWSSKHSLLMGQFFFSILLDLSIALLMVLMLYIFYFICYIIKDDISLKYLFLANSFFSILLDLSIALLMVLMLNIFYFISYIIKDDISLKYLFFN
jgi:hypothetical protein